ncbi:MAG TPA: STAS domain-containing protein [Acidimicrobiales bacterium]|nr:STAS domain-containing protein [Acidimicrobiales bacterium]
MPSSSLAIRVLDLDDMTVVGLDGVVAGDAERLVGAVDRALARRVSTIVVDCSLLESLDAEGSATLADAARHAHDQHSRLVVREPSAATRAVLDLTGTSAVVEYGD